jgi:competence protein ComEA
VTEQLERYRWLIVALFSVPLLAGIAFLVEDRVKDDSAPLLVDDGTADISDIRVYITGAVVNPGIYPMPEDARWGDAVLAAGGFATDANPEAINLAQRVQDEDHILVPRTGQAASAGTSQTTLININTASEAELMSLPGIGEVRANSIISSRTSVGPFGDTEELLVRELIPESIYEDIVALITVSQ